MRAIEIIRKKRDGEVLSAPELDHLISGAVRGEIPGYQMAAWLMAVYFQGLNQTEIVAITRALVQSGKVVEFPATHGARVDKHSTGGVGDKTSLIVAPLAAAAGLLVPMISGRALGHTGGTLDKLESIPGLRTDLSLDEFRKGVLKWGASLIGQTDDLAPADRLLYSLRDVTATVESIPLIISSILSKKIAEGSEGLVLDVKSGAGAFMKSDETAEELARGLVSTGTQLGLHTVAVISDMSQPLGYCIGNALEVQEAIRTLQGEGPSDLKMLCLELTAHMMVIGGSMPELDQARARASDLLETGYALEKFRQIIEFQGGEPRVIDNPQLLPVSSQVSPVVSGRSGYVNSIRADLLGNAAMMLGAGRATTDSSIHPGVGLELSVKVGDQVQAGDVLVKVYYEERAELEKAKKLIVEAFQIGEEPEPPRDLVRKFVS